MTAHFDCIVVGVGGVGSAVIHDLAARGVKVLGIDKHDPGHNHGSSHGETRIIRLVYFEHPDYVPLLKRALTRWQELDLQSPEPLFHQIGLLQAGPSDGEVIPGLIAAARQHQLDMQELTAAECHTRFPGFTPNPEDQLIFDPNAGILRVEACVRRFADKALDSGAELIREEVIGWSRTSTGFEVTTDQQRFTADQLVISPGAWAGQLVPWLKDKTQVLRKSLFWFDNDNPAYQLGNNVPVFLFEQGENTFYGFPQIDDKGVKVGDHAGGLPFDLPEEIDKSVDTRELEAVSLFLRHHLPGVGHQLNDHTTCMYTMSPDGHFIIGELPGEPKLFIAAGLSGHGYKFAPVFGEIFADLVTNGHTDHPIAFLDPQRFC